MAVVISEIINEVLLTGCFPDSSNVKKNYPSITKCQRDNIQCYRTVSLLSIFSKILERSVDIRFSTILFQSM